MSQSRCALLLRASFLELQPDSFLVPSPRSDLPAGTRMKWAFRQAQDESIRELKHVGNMFKK